MKTYRCVQPLTVEQYNTAGYWMPCQQITITPGKMLTVSSKPLIVAAPPYIRLEAKDGLWLELMPDTLAEHFKEVTQ